jgi:hypothetical protein
LSGSISARQVRRVVTGYVPDASPTPALSMAQMVRIATERMNDRDCLDGSTRRRESFKPEEHSMLIIQTPLSSK